jgi:hypothetical protein
MLLAKTQTVHGEVHIHLVNLTAAVEKFLLGVLGAFADTNGKAIADSLLRGDIVLAAKPDTGEAFFCPLDKSPSAPQIIAFLARFSKFEWKLVRLMRPAFLKACRQDLELASKLAVEALGYLPTATQIQINGE